MTSLLFVLSETRWKIADDQSLIKEVKSERFQMLDALESNTENAEADASSKDEDADDAEEGDGDGDGEADAERSGGAVKERRWDQVARRCVQYIKDHYFDDEPSGRDVVKLVLEVLLTHLEKARRVKDKDKDGWLDIVPT